eukprot:gene7493-10209_t
MEIQQLDLSLGKPYESIIKINFGSPVRASMVKNCLEVDDELQPNKTWKIIEVNGEILMIKFRATDLKMLRVAISSFMDMIIVASKTLLEFEEV